MLGIGITTYNRATQLSQTLDFVKRHTSSPHHLVVVDDGSTDTTAAFLASTDVTHILGGHRGIAWNKNRALYYLKTIMRCDDIILLEDDTYPTHDHWEQLWIAAVQRYLHVNLAPEGWDPSTFLSGSGTPSDPFVSRLLTGQCEGFRSEVLDLVGYLDSRFQEYGYEHAEHTQRIIESGHGGVLGWENGEARHFPYLIHAPLHIMADVASSQTASAIAQSAAVWATFRHEQAWRAPWRSNTERAVFLAEMMSARGQQIPPPSAIPLCDWVIVTDRELHLTFDPQTGQIITARDFLTDRVVIRSDGRYFDFIWKQSTQTFLLIPTDEAGFTLTPGPLDRPYPRFEVKRGHRDALTLWHGGAQILYQDAVGKSLETIPGQDTLGTFLFLRYDTKGPPDSIP